LGNCGQFWAALEAKKDGHGGHRGHRATEEITRMGALVFHL
jgi:hypothetical protein